MPVPTIVIFGASGDLTSRKLIPALFRLDSTGLLPEDCQVVGVSRTAFTSEKFREAVEPKVKEAVLGMKSSWYQGSWGRFSRRLHYVAADATVPEGMQSLGEWLHRREGGNPGDRLYHLAVAPELYQVIAEQLAGAGLSREEGAGFRRLVVEKPFGRDVR